MYRIISSPNLVLLERAVNDFINDGYEPVGSVTPVMLGSSPSGYLQAVYKKEKKGKKE